MVALTEDEIIEQLEQITDLQAFIQKANDFLFIGLKNFLPYIFINDDPDIQEYAVKPLLAKAGPLDDIHISLRLVYALGKVRKELYADIFSLTQFNDYLANEANVPDFSHDIVYTLLNNLNAATGNTQLIDAITKMKFSDFTVYSKERYSNLVKTALILSVTTILKELVDECGIKC
ncbi:MltR family transcriptional regulator [Budvicia diplopodorum]|uniref:MltR family transcriptional regulator n=1 Tax=Budvicia diplopodorum TaxID=1119056 RepID=UPI00135A91A2|nr:MltR family transcriptional regulator [Budvicia diplopodorum]